MRIKVEKKESKSGKIFWSGSVFYRDSWYNVALFPQGDSWIPRFSKKVDDKYKNFDLPLVFVELDETGAEFEEVGVVDNSAMELKELREMVLALKGKVDLMEEQLKSFGIEQIEDGPVPF